MDFRSTLSKILRDIKHIYCHMSNLEKRIEEVGIQYNVATYNDLLTLNPSLYAYAYVRNSQGTIWLPGGVGFLKLCKKRFNDYRSK